MLKARQKLGKYQIVRKIAEGGFANVYRANDTIEGIPVALKIPRRKHITPETLERFRKEAKVTAALDHPNILPLKNAVFVDSTFVIVYPLGESTLADRLERRLSLRTAMDYAEQMLQAVAYAHERGVVHCDIKPENMILFAGNRLRLSDFGIAKLALNTRTIQGAGTGTIGYLAPEQAFGRPSLRSDVFSLGLVLYRMFAGELPEWPYEWPPPGFERLRQTLHPSFISFIQKALEVDERKRFRDAVQMLAVFRRLKPRAIAYNTRRRRKTPITPSGRWRRVRIREYRKAVGGALGKASDCSRCGGPMTELMSYCPWCGTHRKKHKGSVSFPARCRRCGRGVKSDWRFCAWCYGPAIQEPGTHEYSDVRYAARCQNPACTRRELMPFMRYCPWCRTKVKRAWRVEPSRDKCTRCRWGVLTDYWSYCPWCGKRTGHT